MATSLDVPLDDLIKSRNGRGWGRSRGQGGARGRGDGQRLARGSWRGRGVGTFRGRGLGVPLRRPLGVNTRSSSFAIAKARTQQSLFLSISRIQITVDT
jgi:THO complex subunit 4